MSGAAHRWYEEWVLPDPAATRSTPSRPIRDDTERRARTLLQDLEVTVPP